MHPTFLDSMSWEMAEVYGAITDQILVNLARHFPFYNAGDPLPKSAFEYQAAKLAEMGQVSKETVQIIRNGLEDADLVLQGVLEQAIIDAVKTAQPELLEAVKKGVFSPAGIPIVAPNQMNAFNLYYQQAANKLNLVNTVMLESTKSAYQQTIAGVVADIDLADRISRTQGALDVAAGETITGVSSWNQALRHATDRLKEGGIVGFVDHAGHQWSAEAYVAMDVRTTVFNTGRAATWETNQNFGNDLYLVSWHSGARPLCYDWQNKVISATNNARTVVDLDGNEIRVYAQSETTYGMPAGLFGINCKHYPTPFIPGVSTADGTPQDKEENDRVYAESQEQRRLERKLREEKRDLMMAKAQGAPTEELNKLRDKCRKSSQDIDDFCKQTGRARHRDREAVYTKREFPDKNRYDVTQFEREQKKEIEKYFSKEGGVQKDYTFDQMTPNEQSSEFIQDIKYVPNMIVDDSQKPQLGESLIDAQIPTPAVLKEVKAAVVPDISAEALDKSIISERPQNEQPQLIQFARFDTSKRTDAQMLAQVNPNYVDGTRGWTNNCQRTVAAQELVYRGYDVTAMPYNASDPVSDIAWNVWKVPTDPYTDPDISILGNKSTFVNNIESEFNKWGDGSRAIVRIKWNQSNGGNGHFIFARRVNGSIIYTDPQDDTVLDINETLSRTTRRKDQMWVMRVDNREVNNNIVYAVKNRK